MKIFRSIAVIILIVSCQPKVKEGSSQDSKQTLSIPKLYIKTTEINGVDKKRIEKSEITIVTSHYFEISLLTQTHSDGSVSYVPNKQLISPVSLDNYKSKDFYIVADEKGSAKLFESTTEFLNYMSEREYDLVDQKESKHRIDYTFKKKP